LVGCYRSPSIGSAELLVGLDVVQARMDIGVALRHLEAIEEQTDEEKVRKKDVSWLL
jgi:hypothetical protein